MTLAVTVKESLEKRKSHVVDAIYYRSKRLTKAKQVSLMLARVEKLNQRFFLGEQPF